VIALAAVPVAIWLYLLLAHAGFWRIRSHFAPPIQGDCSARVVAVIPARDEAGSIVETVGSLKTQTLPLASVIVVDDNSSDGTGKLAAQAGAQVITGRALETGWTGKLWALQQGVQEARKLDPDFLLFTDADVTHHADSLRELVSAAENGGYDLASFMVKLRCETMAEKALIPAFVFFFFMLYPPGRVAGAAGGCVLIRPAALDRIGGLASIRQEVIDDCALARAVARSGGNLWLGLTADTHSTRSYGSFADVGHMISRTAFNQLNHSALLLAGTVAGLVMSYLLPVALLFSGSAGYVFCGAFAWGLMTVAYAPMVRFYGRSVFWSVTLPAIATFYLGATLHSAIRYWRGVGGQWKGRVQDIRS
jgi:hopene-associated glycosyltransferase HpnB